MKPKRNVIYLPSATAFHPNIAEFTTLHKYISGLSVHSHVRGFQPFPFLGMVSLVLGLFPAMGFGALTLTDLSFVSNGGNFINNTIVDSASPIGFTAVGLGQSFLNNSDSTITMPFGSYYAYSFMGFGQHVGVGTISGKFDGTPFSQGVTFPTDITTVANFFSIIFTTGDSLAIGTTGLSADRIRIVADGGGLVADGTNDVIYSFNFTAVPEPSSAILIGLGILGFAARRRKTS